jgi:cytoskeletal protein CcmA (bactofilin family)
MSELSKQALKVENNQSFPNNNAGLITPSALRTFNENIIDSTVNQQVYTTDSASFDSRINNITGSATDTGSLLTTASFDNGTRNLTFTKGDSSTFNVNIPDVSGSVLPSGVVSGSSQVILQQTTGNLSGSRIDGLVTSASFATTASFALNAVIETGSFATTGSNVFIGNQTITGSLLISGSEVVTGPLTASRLQINGITDLNGTIDVSNDATFRGNVLIQSSGEQKLLMRSTSGGGVSQGFDLLIQTSSFIIRDETHDIDFLEFDYISSSADHILKLEANRFEMNSGSLGISGSLTASLQQGYAWVGDSSGRTQAIPTSSFGGGTIDTGSFATTGSNTFDGTQTVKGDVIISASVGAPNQLFIQRSTTGAQQFLRLGPDDNQNNFQFIVTGSDVSPGQPVWGINVQGGQWQNGFDAPTGFINFTNFRSGIELRFGGGQPTARMGVNHISESVQVYAGLSSDGKYIVSSSVDERILEINPTTATVKVSNTISSQIFLNPQTLTGTQTVPSGFNGMLTGPVSNAGTIVIESGSTLVII